MPPSIFANCRVLGDVLREIAASGYRNVFAWHIVEWLLQLAASNPRFASTAAEQDHLKIGKYACSEWLTWLRKFHPLRQTAVFDDEKIKEGVAGTLALSFDEFPPQQQSYVAYGIAEAFDLYFGNHLFGAITSVWADDRWEVEPGRLIPLMRTPWLKKFYDSDLATQQKSMGRDPGVLRSCRLAPGLESEPRLILDISAWSVLGNVLGEVSPPKKGSGRFSYGLAILNSWAEFHCIPTTLPTGNWYLQVKPCNIKLNPSVQRERIERVMKAASKKRVRLMVFPELAFSVADQHWLLDRFAQGAWPGVMMVVAGSAHEFRSGPPLEQANICRSAIAASVGSRLQLEHRKFSAFEDPAGTELLTDVNAQVVLYASGTGGLMKLICKDFLHPQAIDSVRILQPAISVVPSMTPKCNTFQTKIPFIANETQGRALFVNAVTPGHEEHKSLHSNVIVSFPFGHKPFAVDSALPSGNQVPALYVIGEGQRRGKWHSV